MPPTYAELEAVYAQNKRIADFLKVPVGEVYPAVIKLWNQVFALLPPDRPDPKTLLLLNKNEVVAILEAVAPGSSKDMWDYDYAATSKDEWWRFLNEERNRFYTYMRLFNLSYADCVTPDTPIWIKVGEEIDLIEVGELIPHCGFAEVGGIQVWDADGFVDLLKVRRKPNTKAIVRLIDTSDIGLTLNHKVVVNKHLLDGKYKDAESIKREDLIKSLPDLTRLTLDKELAWALGLFFADGSCTLRKKGSSHTWRICNRSEDYLERAKVALEKTFPWLLLEIKRFASYEAGQETNYGKRKEGLSCLDLKLRDKSRTGRRDEAVAAFHRAFYNSRGVKRVPRYILQGDSFTSRSFLEGVVAGDGTVGTEDICSASKLSTMGLAFLAKRAGCQPSVMGPKGFTTKLSVDTNGHKKKQLTYLHFAPEVVDVSTSSGSFVAGDIWVKNCDDHARRVMTSALNWFLLSKTKEWLPRAACGLVMGMKSPPDPRSNHMWNWVIDRDKKLWMHEPNPFFTTLLMWEPVLGDGIEYGHVYRWYGI